MNLLITLLIYCLVIAVLYWGFSQLTLPPPIHMVINVILAIVLAVLLLGLLTGHTPTLRLT